MQYRNAFIYLMIAFVWIILAGAMWNATRLVFFVVGIAFLIVAADAYMREKQRRNQQ